MTVIDQMRAHFEPQLQEVRPIPPVPEWGKDSEPLQIYVRPLTLGDQDKIRPYLGTNDSLVMTLIVRARDAEGKLMFKPVERSEIKRWADPKVLQRVIIDMNKAFNEPSVEDAEKNS